MISLSSNFKPLYACHTYDSRVAISYNESQATSHSSHLAFITTSHKHYKLQWPSEWATNALFIDAASVDADNTTKTLV